MTKEEYERMRRALRRMRDMAWLVHAQYHVTSDGRVFVPENVPLPWPRERLGEVLKAAGHMEAWKRFAVLRYVAWALAQALEGANALPSPHHVAAQAAADLLDRYGRVMADPEPVGVAADLPLHVTHQGALLACAGMTVALMKLLWEMARDGDADYSAALATWREGRALYVPAKLEAERFPEVQALGLFEGR